MTQEASSFSLSLGKDTLAVYCTQFSLELRNPANLHLKAELPSVLVSHDCSSTNLVSQNNKIYFLTVLEAKSVLLTKIKPSAGQNQSVSRAMLHSEALGENMFLPLPTSRAAFLDSWPLHLSSKPAAQFLQLFSVATIHYLCLLCQTPSTSLL